MYIKGKNKKEIKLIPEKNMNIKICPLIKLDKKILKLKKDLILVKIEEKLKI